MGKWDVIVIGGGFSGLSAGALLANAGKKVLVLEKGSYIGGRMFCTEYRGQILDNGAHVLVSTGHTEEIFSRLGKAFPAITPPSTTTTIFYDGKWQDVREIYPRAELRKIIEEDILTRSYEELEEYDDIGLEEWVSKRTDNKMAHLYFWWLGHLMSVGNEYGTISAGDLLIFIKEVVEKNGGFNNAAGAVRGGYGVLTDSLAEALKEKGGEIRLDAKVTDVIFENGKVRGIEVETGDRVLPSQLIDTEFIEAPVVVSTLPIWDLFSLVSEDQFPGWYVDWVKDISKKYVNVYTLFYGMNEVPVGDESIMWWVPEFPRTGTGGGLFWQPTYVESVGQHQACFWLQADWFDALSGLDPLEMNKSAKTRRDARKMFDLIEEDIKDIFPGFFDNGFLWKIRHLSRYSIAEVPGAVRKHRPGIQPPGVENFYLAGDTLQQTRATGTQSAARCVLACVDNILGNK